MSSKSLLGQTAAKARRRGMQVERRYANHMLINPHPECACVDMHFRQWKLLLYINDTSTEADECKWLRQIMEHNFGRVIRDEDFIYQSFTETQFAGWECHCAFAELLRYVNVKGRLTEISDERGYYEAGRTDIIG